MTTASAFNASPDSAEDDEALLLMAQLSHDPERHLKELAYFTIVNRSLADVDPAPGVVAVITTV
jgi:hypothetical protein